MPPKRKRNATMLSPSRGRGFKKPHPPQRQKKSRQNDTEETRDQEKPSKPPSFSQEPQEITNFGLPADFGNFENSDFSLESNMSDFIPVPEVSCFDNVGYCVPLKLKQNIWGWSIY